MKDLRFQTGGRTCTKIPRSPSGGLSNHFLFKNNPQTDSSLCSLANRKRHTHIEHRNTDRQTHAIITCIHVYTEEVKLVQFNKLKQNKSNNNCIIHHTSCIAISADRQTARSLSQCHFLDKVFWFVFSSKQIKHFCFFFAHNLHFMVQCLGHLSFKGRLGS